jgi:hypothetical protein
MAQPRVLSALPFHNLNSTHEPKGLSTLFWYHNAIIRSCPTMTLLSPMGITAKCVGAINGETPPCEMVLGNAVSLPTADAPSASTWSRS